MSPPPSLFRRRVDALLEDPLFNFATISATLASVVTLAAPVLLDLSLQDLDRIAMLDRALLGLIALHLLLSIVGARGGRYRRGLPFLIDLIVAAPLFAWLAAIGAERLGMISPAQVEEFGRTPGLLLINGVRVLRLLNQVQYFYLQREMGLAGDRLVRSPLKIRVLNGVSATLFFLILILGLLFAQVTRSASESQRTLRIQQIQMQAATYGALQARLLFEESTLSVRTVAGGQIQTIHNDRWPPVLIQERLRYGRDFVQLDGQADGLRSGESVQILLVDLRRQEEALELLILALGSLVVAAVLISLNNYLDRLIIEPAERALRVTELRLRGEEIEQSGIEQEPFTEVTRLINAVDQLYQRMRAPARKLLTDERRLRR